LATLQCLGVVMEKAVLNPTWNRDHPDTLTAPLLHPTAILRHDTHWSQNGANHSVSVAEDADWVDRPVAGKDPRGPHRTWKEQHFEGMLSVGTAPGGFWGDWKPHLFT
jgi:hypothetical protein